jgi:pyruvate dehydrogenase E2 component (dihydrolipoamide acetyltransferase)
MADFVMPSLGADMTEGTVLEWMVQPGDTVRKGDIVAVVDTAKAAVEVEVFTEGVVEELLVPVGTKVPVGVPLARIGDGSAVATPPQKPEVSEVSATVSVEEAPAPSAPSPAVTPLVHRVAADLGVDLAAVTGTGPHGRITRADVVHAAGRHPDDGLRLTPSARRVADELGVDLARLAELVRSGALVPSRSDGVISADDVRRATDEMAPSTAPPGVSEAATTQSAPEQPAAPATPTVARSRTGSTDMRQTIARLMARSKREIPHYYLTATVDLARVTGWMSARNRELPVSGRLVPAALILKATALSLRRHPELNGYWVDDGFVPGPGIHLGVAVSLRGGGLIAPAIHNADTLSLNELMTAIRDLVGRARSGRLRASELTDGTVTVTNLGDQGVESVHGVIYPPQVALVGVGRVIERPVAVDGMLTVHPVAVLTLAADHRATDGFSGSRLLTTIDTLLQTPEEL